MNNCRLVILFLIFNVLFLPSAFADSDSIKKELAVQYLELSKAKEATDSVIEAYVDGLAATNPKHNKDQIRAFYSMTQGWEVLKDSKIRILMDTFTEDELKAANDFLRTKNGASFAQKLPIFQKAIAKQINDNSIKVFTKKKQ